MAPRPPQARGGHRRSGAGAAPKAQILGPAELGLSRPDQHDRIALSLEIRGHALPQVLDDSNAQDDRRRRTRPASRFVVERYVPGGDWDSERLRRCADTPHRLAEVPETVRLLRVTEVQAVR